VALGAGVAYLVSETRRRKLWNSVRALYGRVLSVRPRSYDDTTLARKVETEIFRDGDAPKGSVLVNVAEGTVSLRGEVESPDMIEALVDKARSVHGVRGVENLLHLPGTPAPMHQ
jgi:osmotically-inducible protein OsmY